jgi:hypothetical protein
MEEDADLGLSGAPPETIALIRPPNFARDLGPQGPVEEEVHRPVPERHRAGIILGADVERAASR